MAVAGGLGLGGGREEGKKEEGSERRQSPAVARLEMDRGGLATAAGGAYRGGATVELGGGPELGKKGKGAEGILLCPLPWAEVERGGGSVVAGGGQWLWWAVAALRARDGGGWWLWCSEARGMAYL